MNKLSIVIIVILGVVLLAAGVFCFTLIQDKNALTAELNSTQTELASTKAELDTTACTLLLTQQELSVTQAELDTAKGTLTSTRADLTATKDILSQTQTDLTTTNQTLASKLTELNTANDKITSVQKSLDTLQVSVSKTQQQLTTAQETLRGLGITLSATVQCYDARLVDNVTAKNPTWKEMMTFLANDKTENHDYILNVYDCSEFSRDVHNNAEAAGIRNAVVHVVLRNEKVGHAFNAFLTSDYGLVYVDCTGSPDKIVYSRAGKEFRGVNSGWILGVNVRNDNWWDGLGSYYYLATSVGSHAVVESINIFW